MRKQRTPPHGRGGAEAGFARCSEGAWGCNPHWNEVILMDIERISMNLSMSNTLRDFNIGMIRRELDNTQIVGARIAQMIDNIPTAPPLRITNESRINILA